MVGVGGTGQGTRHTEGMRLIRGCWLLLGVFGGVCNIYEAPWGFGCIHAHAEQAASAQEHGGECACGCECA